MRPSFLTLIAFLAGCGGSSSSTSPVGARADNLLIGKWSGTYGQTTGAFSHGTMSITIRREEPSDGFVDIEGTATDAVAGPANIQGGMYDNPTNIYSNVLVSAPDGSRIAYFAGHLVRAADGHIRAILQQELGDGSVGAPFDLAPVAPAP